MTIRSVLFGLFFAATICAVTYFNDALLRQSLIVGNHMPIVVYGPILLFLLFINPLLSAISDRFSVPGFLKPFSAKELSIVIALALASCCVPYSSFLRLLPNLVMLPHHYARTEPGWTWKEDDGTRKDILTTYLPEAMTPDMEAEGPDPLNSFVRGMSQTDEHINPLEIPWEAWLVPLVFWMSLFLALSIALAGLAVAVHKRWSEQEHLAYPVVEFTQALLPEEGGRLSSIFRNRLFWIGTVCVIVFHVNNYLYEWYPHYFLRIPRVFDFGALRRTFPTLVSGGGWGLFYVKVYFSFIGIAYLIAADVSLAVGLGPFVFRYLGGVLRDYGIPVGSGTRFAPRIDRGVVYGGYIGMFLAMLYTGRHYYLNLVRRISWLPSNEDIPEAAVWGGRIFVVFISFFVAILALIGLDWQLAALYALLMVVIFVVMGRIIAETGLFFIAPYLYPCVLIYSVFGQKAIGPQSLMILFVVTCGILIDPRETLMPYLVNGVKLADDCKARIGRAMVFSVVAIGLGLLVATPLTLYIHYDKGVNWNDGWASRMVPKFAPTEVARIRRELTAQGKLEESEQTSGFSRFLSPSPHRAGTIAFLFGLGGVLLCMAGRLRFAKWPVHPVIFLVWGGWAGYQTAWPFLIGGGLKLATVKYGGAKAYHRMKPLMFGLIAGDMLAGIGITVFGICYYFVTGEVPKHYLVLLG